MAAMRNRNTAIRLSRQPGILPAALQAGSLCYAALECAFSVCFFKSGSDLFHQRVAGQAVLLAQDRNGAVLDELIGPADAHDRSVDHLRVQMLHDGAAEAVVQDVILDRADDLARCARKIRACRCRAA